jgi:hypothetical protein
VKAIAAIGGATEASSLFVARHMIRPALANSDENCSGVTSATWHAFRLIAFQLSDEEAESLRSQIATLKKGGRGQHRKYLPYAFTEHGANMAAMVLNSARALEMSVYVVRAFVQLRSVLASDADLGRRVTKLERGHESHDNVIVAMMKAIHKLENVPQTRAIGFFELDENKSEKKKK